ncbi:NADP oxidoreductase coenzyme f420-dependent [Tolypothrix tenuis PCC 7101]|uniref:NADP oxidoreductase coenzyme f420-dependent n=1 Tax=Tolypothrix tenuis PCC 7101 TaxID=231146 RepID=A0A1Z4MVA4_9CYAN|nr:NADPH-dependent F420 reductase [Aulosira sp. FACHB-113]BAY97351.1 NADP oxidoreductase coenzyme f420-dependent [Tolypothrix tenuis PCC 7101]BAZ72140.1 NADP oxidoreductase coenzyme f420-dependent [Aulosira laxa NIES-50]
MKIGILGAGNIGGNLGKIWAAKGHEIFFAVREPHSDKVKALLNELGSSVRTGSLQEAVSFGEVVLLAVHWQNVPAVLQEIQGLMSDKILIDSTNRMIPPPPDTTGSAAEDIARALPGAKVIKAFSTLGANNLTNLKFGSEDASTFICGDDPKAKAIVTQLGEELGFDVVDAGLLNTAPLIESLTKLWVQISRNYGREIALKLLRR